MDVAELVSAIETLRLGSDEVLVVRPRTLLTAGDRAQLHRNLSKLAESMGWPQERIVVLDQEVDLTVLNAEQLGFATTTRADP